MSRRYLGRVVAILRKTEDTANHLLAYLSQLGWEHIDLTGDCVCGRAGMEYRRTSTDCGHSGTSLNPEARAHDVLFLPTNLSNPDISLTQAHKEVTQI